MPKLEGELPKGTWKFVRDGESIVYEETDGPLHSKIAVANNLGEAGRRQKITG